LPECFLGKPTRSTGLKKKSEHNLNPEHMIAIRDSQQNQLQLKAIAESEPATGLHL